MRKHIPLCLGSSGTKRESSTVSHATTANLSTDEAEASFRPELTGSAKLFADAAKEEAEDTPSRRAQTLHEEEPNWTGDERIEDTVLRMLVDKYKPLRTGTIQTAEQKLHQSPPQIAEYHADAPPLTSASFKPSPTPDGSWSSVSLLPPGSPSHRPWHTEFKAPAHATSPSVKFATFPLSPSPSPNTRSDTERARKEEKELRERTKRVGRLTRARESTLDYRLGLGSGKATTTTSGPTRAIPLSMKGWTNLIDDKIEQARRAGLFNSIKGRGKPLARSVEESNPFIAREEFLMNRIVQRSGAAPPWVQLQGELDAAIDTLRHLLLDGWTRRAMRQLTAQHGINPARAAVQGFRDPAWARHERSYHEAALAEVNELVRRYNAVAPYPVRRTAYQLEQELARVYELGGAEILRLLAERQAKLVKGRAAEERDARAEPTRVSDGSGAWISWLRNTVLGWVRRLVRLARGAQ
ncbi:hypothetical protein C8J57DRAFT_1302347 [Mycena rebaudengoi]|nr:hypothetical protein C8J57DRAFT_1302347 [Mycena rebaudengoi]